MSAPDPAVPAFRVLMERARRQVNKRFHADLKLLEQRKINEVLSAPDSALVGESHCYDIEGKQISMDRWIELRSLGPAYGRIALTQVGDYKVSTVWLGYDLDMGVGSHPPEDLFESMVFDAEGKDQRCDRYATRNAAQEGHTRIVEWLKAEEGLGD